MYLGDTGRRSWLVGAIPIAIVSTVILLLLSATACGGDPSPRAAPEPTRPAIPYTTIWSANPGIDIGSRPAELIRAAYDGGQMSAWAGVDYSFPGFADAVADANPYFGYWGTPHSPPKPADSLSRRIVADTVMYRHIASLTANNTHITAHLCTLQRNVKPHFQPTPGVQTGEGSFIGETQPRTLDVELSKPADASPGTAGQRDTDPARHHPQGNNQPSWNVYGNWRIDAIYDLEGRDRNGNVTRTFGDEPECVAWWRQLFPGWTSRTRPGDFQPPRHVNGPLAWYNLLAISPPAPPTYPEWIAPKGTDA